MENQNRTPIVTGRWQKRKVGGIEIQNDWWDIARDLSFCIILGEDPYPVEVDKLSEESYKEAHEILSMAIKEFDVSKAAIHTVRIHMLQALFSRTDNYARTSPISCLSALCQTGS